MLDTINAYINARYGSRRGLVNSVIVGLQGRLGKFESLRHVDWRRVDRLIFVCHGNICRSPLAKAVAEQRFNLKAQSYGLDCTDNVPADPRALEFAKKIGIDLSLHRATHIRNYQPLEGDLVIGMEPKHLVALPMVVANSAQISLIGLWMSVSSPYIHDPYSSEDNYFEKCERAIVSGVEGLASQLIVVGIA